MTYFNIQELCISPTQYMMITFPHFTVIACNVRHFMHDKFFCVTLFDIYAVPGNV